MGRRLVDRGEKMLGSGPADILQAHVDAGERGFRAEYHGLPVVEANQGNVLGHPAPELPQGVGDATGYLIAATEDGVDAGRGTQHDMSPFTPPALTPLAVE